MFKVLGLMTSTVFVAAEPSDPKQRVGTSSSHLEEKITGFLCLACERGPGAGVREAIRAAG